MFTNMIFWQPISIISGYSTATVFIAALLTDALSRMAAKRQLDTNCNQ